MDHDHFRKTIQVGSISYRCVSAVISNIVFPIVSLLLSMCLVLLIFDIKKIRFLIKKNNIQMLFQLLNSMKT